MHRSVLLLLMSALLLSAAVALPLSLEDSVEESLEDSWLEQLVEDLKGHSDEQLDLESSHENSIHKRAAKDSSSSSEEHKDKAKDKANSSGASSSEEQKTTTVAAIRRRRQAPSRENIKWFIERVCFAMESPECKGNEEECEDIFGLPLNFLNKRCPSVLMANAEASEVDNNLKLDEGHRRRRQVSDQFEQVLQKAIEERNRVEKEEKDLKANGSIEDYAQGCEVLEVSSKEANEATYAE